MLRLRNLKKTSDNIIECDYYPESGKSFGHIALDVKKEELIKEKCKKEKEDKINMYFVHAVVKLLKISQTNDFKTNDFKDEYMVAWY